MAIHFLECAAHSDLPPSKKLALMAIADDSDKTTRVGSAGLEAIMAWSGLKKSRALEVIAELVADGYLRREKGGRIGRRAEFTVFPNGCCALHGPIPSGSAQPDPTENGSQNPPRGSDTVDPSASDVPDPKAEVEGPIEGPIEGPVAVGPLPISLSLSTPNPRQAGACNPDEPIHERGCRACGTSPRQIAERERRSRPPKRECRLHRGQTEGSCGPCRSEQIADRRSA